MRRLPAGILFGLLILIFLIFSSGDLRAQVEVSEQVQVDPPPLRRAEPPAADATAEALEQRGDKLRVEKAYLDAVDYYRAALKKKPGDSPLYNKMGIAELLLQRYKEARKDFEQAIRNDRKHADAWNNLGVTYYVVKRYGKALKQYEKAISLRSDVASYYSNLGAAYFSKKEVEKAVLAYNQALQLDPDVLERTSHAGVTAQLPSPEDRAHYDYVMAKLYAKMGLPDRSLEHLRRAMEEGYRNIEDVYKDAEFAELRKDPRFSALMTARPLAIPE